MHRGVYNHSLVLKKASALCVIIALLWALKVLAKWGGQSMFTKFRAASCHCVSPCPCFASCNCCHDPFIVRSAQTCPPFAGFTQLAHLSRCSRSTLTTVCFCARVSVFTSGLCVFFGSLCSYRVCSPVTRSIIGSSPSSCSGVWDPWSVGYQSCKIAMLL